jgi:hypothetical protein
VAQVCDRNALSQKGTLMRQMLLLTGLFALLPVHESPGAVVFDTAAQPIPGGSGTNVGDFNWPFHRFQLGSTTTLSTVGGYFTNYSVAETAFAAIVQLSASNDNPDSLDLTTPDVLATTLFSVGEGSFDIETPLNLTLAPGWYALQFGTGAFGAPSGGTVAFILTDHFTDLNPFQGTRVAIQNGHPTEPPAFIGTAPTSRFFATTIPEPAAIVLASLGLLGSMGSCRLRLRKAELRSSRPGG